MPGRSPVASHPPSARRSEGGSTAVKFHAFHLMPYPYLPDDFRQRYRGVWVDLPASELYDPVLGHGVYHDYLDELEFADQMGFDGICVNEHHQNAYGLMPSPNLMAATLTRRTRRAKIVVMGNSVALYNPRPAWPRSSRCSTSCRAGASSPASPSARRWTPATRWARRRRPCGRSTARAST